MSARALRTFTPVLREIEAGLRLPIPERVRILRELEADLTDLSERFMAQGVPADEAQARAQDALVPQGDSLLALYQLHTPLYRRMTRGVAGDRLRAAERLALLATTTVVVVLGAVGLTRVDLLQRPSPFLWPVLGLGGVVFALVLAKVFQLWVKGDHARPSAGLGAILGTAGATLGLGFLGVLVDFYWMAAAAQGAPAAAEAMVFEWLVRDAVVLAASILVALAGGLAWFVLAQWVTLMEEEHRDVLGLDANPDTTGGE